jgi:hypothetical protein
MKTTTKTPQKGRRRKGGRLSIRELEKKILPTSKKPPLPPPYAPGTYYGLARRGNIR